MILTRGDGSGRVALHFPDSSHIFRRHRVFQPEQMERFQGTGHLNSGTHAVIPMAVDGEPHLGTNRLAHGAYQRGRVFDLAPA
jgi:hypothetical protein